MDTNIYIYNIYIYIYQRNASGNSCNRLVSLAIKDTSTRYGVGLAYPATRGIGGIGQL